VSPFLVLAGHFVFFLIWPFSVGSSVFLWQQKLFFRSCFLFSYFSSNLEFN